MLAFAFFYVGAFHDPTPRQVSVAVVGPPAVAAQLNRLPGDPLDARQVSSRPDALSLIDDREVYGAYEVATNRLFVASAEVGVDVRPVSDDAALDVGADVLGRAADDVAREVLSVGVVHHLADERRGLDEVVIAPGRVDGELLVVGADPVQVRVVVGRELSCTSRRSPLRKVRRAGQVPEDAALYRCQFGRSFTAAVTTCVACPSCGTGQAW